MEFTRELFEELKKVQATAIADGKKSFMFHGKELLVSYAMYLIEYLTIEFKHRD